MNKITFALALLVSLVSIGAGQSGKVKVEESILAQMSRLTKAHLKSDPGSAAGVFDDRLILTSQSGRVYTKNDGLANIKNKFGYYKNSAIKFLHISKKVVIVNYVNERQIGTFPRSSYRITAVWVKTKRNWEIISLQSSKVLVRQKK